MARPPKLTPAVSARLILAIAGGNTRADSAAAAGISERTLYAWLERARDASSGPLLQLSQALKKAEAQAVLDSVEIVRKAAHGWTETTTTTVTEAETTAGEDVEPGAVILNETKTVRTVRRFAWQAAAWWLERRHPEAWGRQDRPRMDQALQDAAEQLAGETGLDPAEVVADAKRLLARLD